MTSPQHRWSSTHGNQLPRPLAPARCPKYSVETPLYPGLHRPRISYLCLCPSRHGLKRLQKTKMAQNIACLKAMSSQPFNTQGVQSLASFSSSKPQYQSFNTLLTAFHFHALDKEMEPTPVFLPGESQGRGSLVGCNLWGLTESDTTEETQQQEQQILLSFSSSCRSLCTLTIC